jgi:hypothetical protein
MTLEKTLNNLRKFGWFKGLKSFAIEINGNNKSKKIFNTLISLGYNNPSNLHGNADEGYYYLVKNKNIFCKFYQRISSDTEIITLDDIPYK